MSVMKNSILEEPLIHLIIWIRNDDVMNEKKDIKTESTHETNKDKYSIVIVLLYSVDVLCMIDCLH